MAKDKSPSFIHEFKLKITPKEIKILDIRIDVARQIYNSCLGEALRRLDLMRASKIYARALSAPKKTKQRNELYG